MIRRLLRGEGKVAARIIATESQRMVDETGHGVRLEFAAAYVDAKLADGHLIWVLDREDDNEEFERYLIWVEARANMRTNFGVRDVVFIHHVWAPSRRWRFVLKWINEELADRRNLGQWWAVFTLGTPIAETAQGVVQGRTDILDGHSVVRLDQALQRLRAAWGD